MHYLDKHDAVVSDSSTPTGVSPLGAGMTALQQIVDLAVPALVNIAHDTGPGARHRMRVTAREALAKIRKMTEGK